MKFSILSMIINEPTVSKLSVKLRLSIKWYYHVNAAAFWNWVLGVEKLKTVVAFVNMRLSIISKTEKWLSYFFLLSVMINWVAI